MTKDAWRVEGGGEAAFLGLRCSACSGFLEADRLRGACPDCGSPLRAEYDCGALAGALTPYTVAARPRGLWRWRELLPLPPGHDPVTFSEGDCPLLELPELARDLGLGDGRLLVLDESRNPTGSFKARGMSVAVSMAKHLGATALCAPTAGNAGSALALYGARAGLPVHLAMPADAPPLARLEAELFGARVRLVEGTIADCGKALRGEAEAKGWFDLSTLKEPYRLEGKKTMGFEIAEALGYDLPDVVLCPTGGGTGLLGIWKAFDELRRLGWIPEGATLPRMVAVQTEGCAPIVRAFSAGEEEPMPPRAPRTRAAGLRVPAPAGGKWILEVLRESRGAAVAVSDEALLEGARRAAALEGLSMAPESGSLVPALARLLEEGLVRGDECVVLVNTAGALKTPEVWAPV